MWVWQQAVVGFLLVAVGTELAYARVPAWFGERRDPVTGEPLPETRVLGKGLLATGVGLVLMSWVGTPEGLWAGVAAVAFLTMGAVLDVWATRMRGAVT